MLEFAKKVLIIGLITCVLGELSARYVVGLNPISTDPQVWMADPVLGWVHRPGAEEVFTRVGFQQHVQINSRGLRERDGLCTGVETRADAPGRDGLLPTFL